GTPRGPHAGPTRHHGLPRRRVLTCRPATHELPDAGAGRRPVAGSSPGAPLRRSWAAARTSRPVPAGSTRSLGRAMTAAQSQRRRGRATAVVAVLATAIGLLVGLASPAGAASLTFERIEPDTQGTLKGTAGGRTQRLTAGRFIVTVDGQRATGYCIDIHNQADHGPLDEIDWETSGVSNLEAIKAILVNYTADGDEPADFPLVG